MNASLRTNVIQLTPPGRGAVATLRIEGPNATALVQRHFYGKNPTPLAAVATDRTAVGHFGGKCGEEVVVRRLSDDAIELHCHGGSAAVAMIESLLLDSGCHRIAWRDWIDNVAPNTNAAAAWKALADATTERTAAILLDQYHGAFDRELAEVQHLLDSGDRQAAKQRIDTLAQRATIGRHLVAPWRAVLAGRVNVGKSRLINALVGFDRAIVHPMPGATRDVVTATTVIDGWPIELCDTAGLRMGREFAAIHPVEKAGIERTGEQLATADLVILVFDQSETWSAYDEALRRRWAEALVVHNKCDLPENGPRPAGIRVCARLGDGIPLLLASIVKRLVPTPPPPGAAVPFTTEQMQALERLQTAVLSK